MPNRKSSLAVLTPETLSRYAGRWIAATGGTVIADSDDFDEVYLLAHERGIESPFVVKIPEESYRPKVHSPHKRRPLFQIGDIYEDCSYHPVWCTEVEGDDITGISLFDGSRPRSCSIKHCGVRKLTPDEVEKRIKNREEFLEAERIWRETGDDEPYKAVFRKEGYDV